LLQDVCYRIKEDIILENTERDCQFREYLKAEIQEVIEQPLQQIRQEIREQKSRAFLENLCLALITIVISFFGSLLIAILTVLVSR